jgi:hypothetical protein
MDTQHSTTGIEQSDVNEMVRAALDAYLQTVSLPLQSTMRLPSVLEALEYCLHAAVALQQAVLPLDATEYIYFITAIGTDFVKIGYSRDPEWRLNELQAASMYRLRLVEAFGVTNGRAVEQDLHERLRHLKVKGEWFRISARLLALLLGRVIE